jgi:3-deoxy-7-phosphoheptulonate synthase
MLLQLRQNPNSHELESVLRLARELGYRVAVLGETRTLIELTGQGRPEHRSLFEDLPAVARVLESSGAPERHEKAGREQERPLRVRDAVFGCGSIALIAGPCAVEDPKLLLETARAVQAAGATLLRGGAFKPRTSPYSFQGSGEEGLGVLADVREAIGIGIATEVLDVRDVESVWKVADLLQVGSRNMHNSALLRELGRQEKPVLLKRGFAATVREFLLAAEFILAGGNEQVLLCERGIRGFDEVTRNVLDLGAMAYIQRVSHLPIVVDPSHAAGRADLVRPLARAGLAAGADGLIVEVHPAPATARCDGFQAISFAEFASVAADARAIAAMDGRKLSLPGGWRAGERARAQEPVA